MRAPKLLLAAICGALSISTSANSILGVPLADPVWFIEPATDTGTEKSVARDEIVTQAKLIPGGVVEIKRDFSLPGKSKILLASGSHLFLFRFEAGEIYCATGNATSAMDSYPCLIDTNQDARFDKATKIYLPGTTSRFGAGMPHKNRIEIAPIAFEKLDPARFAANQTVNIVSGSSGKSNSQFYVSIVLQGKSLPIGGLGASAEGPLPRRLTLLRAQFLVVGQEGKVSRVRIEKAIPSQPFQISSGLF